MNIYSIFTTSKQDLFYKITVGEDTVGFVVLFPALSTQWIESDPVL